MAPLIRVQIISDLHLECNKVGLPQKQYDHNTTPIAPILALLGDIGFVEDFKDADKTGKRARDSDEFPPLTEAKSDEQGFFGWLEQRLWDFEHVLYIMGNHEPYGTSWPETKAKMKAFESRMGDKWMEQQEELGKGQLSDNDDPTNSSIEKGRFSKRKNCSSEDKPLERRQGEDGQVILDRKRGQLIFLDGSSQFRCSRQQCHDTLLHPLLAHIISTQKDNISSLISDFTHITKLGCREAQQSLQQRRSASQQPSRTHLSLDRKIMVMTQYAPWDSEFSSAFASDLRGKDVWEDDRVTVWAFGHTHYNCDVVIERIRKRKGGHYQPFETCCRTGRISLGGSAIEGWQSHCH